MVLSLQELCMVYICGNTNFVHVSRNLKLCSALALGYGVDTDVNSYDDIILVAYTYLFAIACSGI